VASAPPGTAGEPLAGEAPIFRPPRISPETRTAWIVVGVAVLVVGAGVVALAYRTDVFGPPGGPPSAKLGLATPTFATILCSTDGEVYDLTYFPIEWIQGSSSVSTAQFGLSLLTLHNTSISPNGSAPVPVPNLPCAAPIPNAWYAELYAGGKGTLATFPVAGTGGAAAWTNASSAPVTLTTAMAFVFITDGDFTGTGDHLSAFGTGVTAVTLGGNTTFPAYQHP